jgi:hypothetical protein
VRLMSVGYIILTMVQPTNITRTHLSNAACEVVPGDEQIMSESYRSH